MKKVATLVILLAGMLACRAHDAYSTVNTKGWSTTPSAASRAENSSYLDVTGDQSVVVNWLLVCEDLCGAGFGGPICGKHCLSSPPSASNTENEKYKTVNICPDLCDFGLGGKNCDCGQNSSKPSRNAEELCNAACQHFNLTINGCSQCLSEETRDSNHTTPGSIPSMTTDFNGDHNGWMTTTLTSSSTVVDPVKTTTQPPPTTPSFTTISSTTMTTTSASPDWDAVCVDLCKQGEGGALCNCDLPPLSRKSN